MSRAELRRKEKEAKKAKTATYNLTKEQLDIIIEKAKQEATDDAVSTMMIMTMAIPSKILKDHYWVKTYQKKLPGFVDYILDYYKLLENGELDIEDLQKELMDYAGIKLFGK